MTVVMMGTCMMAARKQPSSCMDIWMGRWGPEVLAQLAFVAVVWWCQDAHRCAWKSSDGLHMCGWAGGLARGNKGLSRTSRPVRTQHAAAPTHIPAQGCSRAHMLPSYP